MKRSCNHALASDAEDLSFHLSAISRSLQNMHRLHNNENEFPQLLRSCLHMYNALEEGLNYLDDRARSMPEVQHTQELAALLLESVAATPDTLVQQSIHMPLTMLQNTLAVLHEELAAPQDPAMQERQAVLFGTPGESARRKCF